MSDRIEELEEEVTKLQQLLANAHATAEGAATAYEAKIRELKEEIEEYDEAEAEMAETVEDFQARVLAAQKENKDLLAQIASLQDGAETTSPGAGGEAKALAADLAVARNERDEARMEVDALRVKVGGLEAEVEAGRTALEAEKAKVEELEEEVEAAVAEAARGGTGGGEEELQAQLEEAVEGREALQEERDRLAGELEALEKEVIQMKMAHANDEFEREQAIADAANQKAKYKAVKKELKELKASMQ